MPASRLEYLFSCYLDHSITLEEKAELMILLADPENEKLIKELLERVIETAVPEHTLDEPGSERILQNILRNQDEWRLPDKSRRTFLIRRIQVAASILVLVGAACFLFYKQPAAEKQQSVVKQTLAKPSSERVFLTMADGSTINLDAVKNGILPGNTSVTKQDSLLVYKVQGSSSANTPAGYNLLSTRQGGQYQVILPDGSKVWLNAVSSLRYPTKFTGREREVELTGEAYFEVSKNRKKPFRVNVGGMHISVLGTHFNVNAYADDHEIRTSLLEGRVKVVQDKQSDFLEPGQQAVVNNKESGIRVRYSDMNEVMAWKNGLFEFKGADIISIMRQISRWYDVEVTYAGKVPVRRFEGKISKKAPLSEVLHILELSDVKFSVVAKKITVL